MTGLMPEGMEKEAVAPVVAGLGKALLGRTAARLAGELGLYIAFDQLLGKKEPGPFSAEMQQLMRGPYPERIEPPAALRRRELPAAGLPFGRMTLRSTLPYVGIPGLAGALGGLLLPAAQGWSQRVRRALLVGTLASLTGLGHRFFTHTRPAPPPR